MSKSETDYQGVPTSEQPSSSPPPSYNGFNIISQLKAAKELDDPKLRARTAVSIVLDSVVSTVCIALFSALPIAQLIIGIFNKEKCQIEPKIPLWLIVSGAGGIVLSFIKIFSNIIVIVKRRKNSAATEPVVLSCFSGCGSIFMLVWFILGNIWVYSNWNLVQYSPILDPNNYCDKLTYLFAFWSITLTYVIIGLCCVCLCSVLVISCGAACCLANKKRIQL